MRQASLYCIAHLASPPNAVWQLGESLAAPQHILIGPAGSIANQSRQETKDEGQCAAVELAVLRPTLCCITAEQVALLVSHQHHRRPCVSV